MPSAAEVIRLLDLKPHPEGGHFCETFRDPRTVEGGRAASTAIYFLLARGERSHWHRVDAAEAWHYHAGAALQLEIANDAGGRVERVTLGGDLAAGERPQAIVPAHAWQAARSLGGLDPGGLHGGARFRVQGIRARAQGLGAGLERSPSRDAL